MATVKTAYTAEQSAELVAAYSAGESLENLAVKFGKSVKSVVAKLSREGVYQKKERLTKTGESVVKKESLADQLGMLAGLNEADTSSLEKANKTALAALLKVLKDTKLSPPSVI